MWIFAILIATFGLDCQQKRPFRIVNSVYPFTLAPLPYDSTFLAEVIPSSILLSQYTVIQNTYLTYLNAYISLTPIFGGTSLSNLCSKGWNNGNLNKFAGGLYNHYLYYWSLTASSCASPVPTGNLLAKINASWGSYTKFVAEFQFVANNVFGNGWIWLCYNTTGSLEIRTTEYEENTLMESSGNMCYPVLGIDLWEHAYYERFTYNKLSHVTAVWDLIDWNMVEYFYDSFAKYFLPVPF